MFIFLETIVMGGNEAGVEADGAGDNVDGVVDVVVQAGLGVPIAVEKVFPMSVNRFSAKAHWKSMGGENRDAMGTV